MKITKKQVFLRILWQTALGAVIIYTMSHTIPYIFVGVRMTMGMVGMLLVK